MKILILGGDGYIGHPLSIHLKKRGHEVFTLDNFMRRLRAKNNLTPERKRKVDIETSMFRLCPSILPEVDTIVHLAQQPSAPWSMIDFDHANETQMDNVSGTLRLLWIMREYMPDAHLVKLGSMGEYGTPEVDIPEGFVPDNCIDSFEYYVNCPLSGMSFPKQPGSFYHLSKVFDSMNIDFACRMWGLKSTDIMQGVVFGLNYGEELTRFDYDEHFGTVINRFCAQAIAGIPLTVYGKGGQTRPFLPLSDSIECLTLSIENPPEIGEYRVFNQYAETRSVLEIAEIIKSVSIDNVKIQHINNPRKEKESHTYETTNQKLRDLGYDPKWDFAEEIINLLAEIAPYKEKIDRSVIQPTTTWG